MKTKIIFTIILILQISIGAFAQQTHPDHNYWQFSPRVGYDIPSFNNNTPYIDYKGGIEVGASVDYYFTWFGLGFDFDYIKNKPESTYPTTNLFDATGTALTDFSLTEEGITRIFYGIGPSFKYQNTLGNFHAELNTRIGLASLKGGRTELRENTVLNDQLNFHAGYDTSSVLTAKGQLRFTYFFNQTFGIHLGGYYMKHFDVEEASEAGMSSRYRTFTTDQGSSILTQGGIMELTEPCNCDISSVGLFAGVTIKLKPKHTPKCCDTCEKYALAVTAKDKFTKELLPNTSVALKNAGGQVIKTGTTNDFGVVVFDDITPDDYLIEGLLYEISLETNTTNKGEFVTGETLQKEILYGDRSFILQGRAVKCNTAQGLAGASVILSNTLKADQKISRTNSNGEYTLHLAESGTFTIRAKKDKYFSQTETITPSEYDRNTTLFVKLEICAEEADCGKAITLQNILYDLDKFFIRPDAKPELNRLVQFMKDNPTIKVEVSSHTDSRASNSYNQILSQNRASAAVDYLVSQGIPRSRLSGVGYGETRLLNECADVVDCSESKHQLNRRTEMKVICN